MHTNCAVVTADDLACLLICLPVSPFIFSSHLDVFTSSVFLPQKPAPFDTALDNDHDGVGSGDGGGGNNGRRKKIHEQATKIKC